MQFSNPRLVLQDFFSRFFTEVILRSSSLLQFNGCSIINYDYFGWNCQSEKKTRNISTSWFRLGCNWSSSLMTRAGIVFFKSDYTTLNGRNFDKQRRKGRPYITFKVKTTHYYGRACVYDAIPRTWSSALIFFCLYSIFINNFSN